jgi:hypothetical protein
MAPRAGFEPATNRLTAVSPVALGWLKLLSLTGNGSIRVSRVCRMEPPVGNSKLVDLGWPRPVADLDHSVASLVRHARSARRAELVSPAGRSHGRAAFGWRDCGVAAGPRDRPRDHVRAGAGRASSVHPRWTARVFQAGDVLFSPSLGHLAFSNVTPSQTLCRKGFLHFSRRHRCTL